VGGGEETSEGADSVTAWAVTPGGGLDVPDGLSGNGVASERGADGTFPVEVAKFICCERIPVGVGLEFVSLTPETKIDKITTRKPTINTMIIMDLFFWKKLITHL
jgi:hypothetical protein